MNFITNVGRNLAIVLDDRVRSDPVIKDRIPGGVASITGIRSDVEAKDLAIVLQAGALPAPINIIQEMTVGPSLGADSPALCPKDWVSILTIDRNSAYTPVAPFGGRRAALPSCDLTDSQFILIGIQGADR